MKKIYTILLLIFFSVKLSFAQPGPNPYTARLTVVKGNYVDFNFNSLKKYQDGITFTNWTRFIICFHDPDNPASTWQLDFHANSPNIVGETGVNLNLNVLELEASDGGGNLSATYHGPLELTNVAPYPILVSNGQQGDERDNIVDITYKCGVTNKLLGERPDHYSVDIIFTLSAE